MIVIHAAWNENPGAMWFWGESVREAMRPRGKAARNGRGGRLGGPIDDGEIGNAHPFSTSGTVLRSMINDLFGNQANFSLEIAKKRIWLPSMEGQPACSLKFNDQHVHDTSAPSDKGKSSAIEVFDGPGLDSLDPDLAPKKASRGRKSKVPPDASNGGDDTIRAGSDVSRLALHPWIVEVVSVPAISALDAWLVFVDAPVPGVMLGASFKYWREVARFAFGVLTQEMYFPSIMWEDHGGESCRARWRAVIPRDKLMLVESLTACMPPSCLAFYPPRTTPATSTHRQEITSFIDATIDGFIRLAFQGTTDPTIQPEVGSKRPRKTGRVVKSWIEALVSASDRFDGEVPYLLEFSTGFQAWATPCVASHVNADFRTSFKVSIEDEGQAAESWTISFSLQARDDPSLLIPAGMVWQERTSVLKHLAYRFVNPQEKLLEDLGRASKIYPPIERSLDSAKPEALQLSTQDALSFLHDTAPLFEQEGFGVIVPNWWNKKSAKLSLAMKVRSPKTSGNGSVVGCGLFGLESIVQYDWHVALGDEIVSRAEFEALVKLKAPVVRFRGQWVELNPRHLEKLRTILDKGNLAKPGTGTTMAGEIPIKDAIKLGFGLGLEAPGISNDIPVTVIAADEATEKVLGALRNDTKITPVPLPAGFVGTMRPYQLAGVSWMSFLRQFGFGACLADDMGLGKTIEVIALLLHEKESGLPLMEGNALSTPSETQSNRNGKGKGRGKTKATARERIKRPPRVSGGSTPSSEPTESTKPAGSGSRASTLLICPMSVIGNWTREIAKFGPSLSVHVHYGPNRATGDQFWETARGHDITITTYALAGRDRDLLARSAWTTIVLDEAQNIKNFTTKQAQSIKSLASTFKLALTGTPIENRLLELWSIMDFLNPAYMGSHDGFQQAFSIPIERYHDPARRELLQKIVQPFVLRRLKSDKTIISDLPDKIEQRVYCTLTKEQASLYEVVVQEMLTKIDVSEGIKRRGQILAGIMKLKQICNHPAQFLHDGGQVDKRSGKVIRLLELLGNILDTEEKAIMFTQFKEMGEMLKEYLESRLSIEIPFLHGGTTKGKRDAMIQEFQRPESHVPLFILSLKAGGTGLNLTTAGNVIHFDRWWNPAVENQASDRAYRIGQTQNVRVYKFICTGTLEERIDEMIERKMELANGIIPAGEQMLSELSTAELRGLLALNRDTIEED